MKGELKVSSQLHQGSEFYFTVNLAAVDDKIPEKLQLIPYTDLSPFTGIKILVAEDNRINSLLIRKYLITWQIEVKIVENGKEAIEALQHENFDLIIMDTRMPVMNGFESARHIRKTLKIDTPILSLSATVLAEEVAEAYESGMNDTLSKPFQPARLHEKIEYMLNFLN